MVLVETLQENNFHVSSRTQIFLIPVTELILVFQSVIQILNCIYWILMLY